MKQALREEVDRRQALLFEIPATCDLYYELCERLDWAIRSLISVELRCPDIGAVIRQSCYCPPPLGGLCAVCQVREARARVAHASAAIESAIRSSGWVNPRTGKVKCSECGALRSRLSVCPVCLDRLLRSG